MSIIGVIAVYKCDGCEAVKTLSTEIDLQGFSKWLSGKTKDFCPSCKFTSVPANPSRQTDLATEKIVTILNRRVLNCALQTPNSEVVKEAA